MHRLVIITLLFLSAICSFTACAQQPDIAPSVTDQSYRVNAVVSGLGVPWGFVWLSNGDMLISERGGEMRVVRDGQLLDERVANVPEAYSRGQGGLLDLALHPEYRENGWIYLTLSSTEGGGGAHTALMRFRFDAENLALRDRELLYKGRPNSRSTRHFGSRIAFDDEGYLYFSIGDRGSRDVNPQDISRDGGKIYRLHADGSIPENNPFVDREDAVAAIYAYGVRNPQGLARHPATGEIWEHEHGPRGGDEINIIRKGANYGWPVISYGINYSGTEFAEDTARVGMEQPVWYWDPSIAPSGMTFVTSDRYPEWKGHLLVGSLKFNYLVLCRLDGDRVTGQETLFEGIGRVRTVREGPDGYLYVGIDEGKIVRIEPK